MRAAFLPTRVKRLHGGKSSSYVQLDELRWTTFVSFDAEGCSARLCVRLKLTTYESSILNLAMSSQPIVVPGGEHRLQPETHSVPVGSSADSYKTMTPPNVSRSLSRKCCLFYVSLLYYVLCFHILVRKRQMCNDAKM